MRDIVQSQTEIFTREHKKKERWKKAVTAMAAVVVFCTTYALILPAITWERSLICELEEHEHTLSCYKEVPAETDDSSGLTRLVLVCEKDVHVHDDACFDAPPEYDDGYSCGMVEHTHNELCYFSDGSLRCTIPEHTHTSECCEPAVEDHGSDLSYLSYVESNGSPAERVLAIAQSQVGFTQSYTDCIELDGEVQGYTYYGDIFGDPYGDWNCYFASFCVNQANIDGFPVYVDSSLWTHALAQSGLFYDADEGYLPSPGDLMFFNDGHVAIVSETIRSGKAKNAKATVIEGDLDGTVDYITYKLSSRDIYGYASISEYDEAIGGSGTSLENLSARFDGEYDSVLFSDDLMTATVFGNYAANNASDPVLVIAGSDYQESSTSSGNFTKQVKTVKTLLGVITDNFSATYGSPYGYLSGGDYTYAQAQNNISLTRSCVSTITDAITDVCGDNVIITHVQGNHDAPLSDVFIPGENDTDYYGVFVMNEDDYSSGTSATQAAQKSLADELDQYLSDKVEAGYDKPVFIISHVPLHFSSRTKSNSDAIYATYFYNAINKYGDDLNIFFIFGHNHSGGQDDYLGGSAVFLPKGSELCIAKEGSKKSCQTVEINFTYMNYGYTGFYTSNNGADTTLTMTSFIIDGDDVTVSRWSAAGQYPLKSVGKGTNGLTGSNSYGPNTDTYASPFAVDGPIITPQYTYRTLYDSTTGLSVTANLASDAELNVTKYSSYPIAESMGLENYIAYDIDLTGYDGDVTVHMPLDINSSPCDVMYHIVNGEMVPIDAEFYGTYAEFVTDSFSDYLGAVEEQILLAAATNADETYWVPITSSPVTGKDYMIVYDNGTTKYALTYPGSGTGAASTELSTTAFGDYTVCTNVTDYMKWNYTSNSGLQNVGVTSYYLNLGSSFYSTANRKLDFSYDSGWTIKRNGSSYSYYLTSDNSGTFSRSTSSGKFTIYEQVEPPADEYTYWVRCTALSDFTTEDGAEYMIIRDQDGVSAAFGNVSYNTIATGNVTITAAGTQGGTPYYEITGDGATNNYVWTFSNISDNTYTLRNAERTARYVSLGNGSAIAKDSGTANTLTRQTEDNTAYWQIKYGSYYLRYTSSGFTSSASTTNANLSIFKKITVSTIKAVTFNMNGGGDSVTNPIGSNGRVTFPANPTLSGYTFDGWFTSPTGGTQKTASDTFTTSTTLYAHWTKNATPPPQDDYVPTHSKTIDAFRDRTDNPHTDLDNKARNGTVSDIDDLYRLYLDVGPEADYEPVDVIIVVDTSSSMNSNKDSYDILSSSSDTKVSRLSAMHSLLNGLQKKGQNNTSTLYDNGLIRKIMAINPNNRIALVKFNEHSEVVKWKDGSTWKSNFASTDAVNLGYNQGTNYMAAMIQIQNLIEQSTASKKIVLFVSDGEPNYYYNDWRTGSNVVDGIVSAATDDVVVAGKSSVPTADQTQQYIDCIPIFKQWVENQGNVTVSTISIGTEDYNFMDEMLCNGGITSTSTNFQSLLTAMENMITHSSGHFDKLSVSDTLSQYVDFYYDDVDFTIHSVNTENGNAETLLYEGSFTNGVFSGSTTTAGSGLIKSVSVSGKTVNVTYNTGTAKNIFRISFNVKTTQTAYDEYADNRLAGRNGYNGNTGDAGTDYGSNSTSSNKGGFNSNASGTLTYTPANEPTESYTLPYDDPVVQASDTSLDVEKQWVDGSADHSGDSVTVELYKTVNGQAAATGRTLTLSSANNWAGTFDHIAKGQTYSVVELVSEGDNLYRVEYEPVTDRTTGATVKITVKNILNTTTFTAQKQDMASHPLTGAEFELYLDANLTEQFGETYYTDNSGTLTIEGLSYETTYYLVESKAPPGFERMPGCKAFSIKADGTIDGVSPGDKYFATSNLPEGYNAVIKNSEGTVLPSTGGFGTRQIYTTGVLLIAGALMCGCIMRRKRERRSGQS